VKSESQPSNAPVLRATKHRPLGRAFKLGIGRPATTPLSTNDLPQFDAFEIIDFRLPRARANEGAFQKP